MLRIKLSSPILKALGLTSHQFFILLENFTVDLIKKLLSQEVGNDLVLPLANIVDLRIVSRIPWELFCKV